MTATLTADDQETLLEAAGHELRLEALLTRGSRAVPLARRGTLTTMASDVRDQARGLRRHAGASSRMPRGVTALGRLGASEALNIARALAGKLEAVYARLHERLVRAEATEAAIYVGICGRAKREILEQLEAMPRGTAVRYEAPRATPRRPRPRPRPKPILPRERRQEMVMPTPTQTETTKPDRAPSRLDVVAHEVETQLVEMRQEKVNLEGRAFDLGTDILVLERVLRDLVPWTRTPKKVKPRRRPLPRDNARPSRPSRTGPSTADMVDEVLRKAEKPLRLAEISERIPGKSAKAVQAAMKRYRNAMGWILTGTKAAARWTHKEGRAA